MDPGIAGFFALLAVFAAAAVRFRRRQAVIDRAVGAAGFAAVERLPDPVTEFLTGVTGGIVDAAFERGVGRRVRLARLTTGTGDESEVVAAVVVELPDSEAELSFVAGAYSGASPESMLGRVGLRLTEMASDWLGSLHRLTDTEGLLATRNRGFVVWAGVPGDVSTIVPQAVIDEMRRPGFGAQGVATEGRLVVVWAGWRHAPEVMAWTEEIAAAIEVGS